MARPESHDDLGTWALKGHSVATIPSTFITRFPSLGQHLLAALAEADRLGLAIVDDEIVVPLTRDELDAKLRNAQRSWDFDKEKWEKLLAGEPLETWQRNSALAWAKAEGLDVPEDVTA